MPRPEQGDAGPDLRELSRRSHRRNAGEMEEEPQRRTGRACEGHSSSEVGWWRKGSGQTLRDAQFNYDFVKNGGGIHNIVYAMRIIEATKKALQDGAPRQAVPH